MEGRTEQQFAQIDFKYEQGQGFQTFYATGLTGGLTARSQMYFSLYVERQSIPKKSMVQIDLATGQSTPEKTLDVEHVIIREVQAGILLDIGTAIALRDLLNEKISEYHIAQEEIKKQQG